MVGRPRSIWRQLAHPQRYGETVRTQVDCYKASNAVYELMKIVAAEQGKNPHDVQHDEMLKRFPKYYRGQRPRITLLRHFAVLDGDPELPKILVGFHDLTAWRTAREGAALLMRLLGRVGQ